MSYNIDNVKVYEISLRISKDVMKKMLDKFKDKDWVNFNRDLDDKWRLESGEGSFAEGIQMGDWLVFSDLVIGGEGSGTDWNDIFKPILKLTKGKYVARFVWEGGDSIAKVICKDGEIIEEELE